jgi:hypothetical protein
MHHARLAIRCLAAGLGLGLAGCAPLVPETDGAEPPAARVAPYPTLVPLEPLLAAEAAARAVAAEGAVAAVEARAAQLRARAAALRQLPAPGG